MASDLLSGPDLGAGFLHQLSRDRDGDTTWFTFHAQDGGADANGPPRGPLAPLGFEHPPSPCMYGGPRCWHRRFLLPFDATPRVLRAYQRHRFVLEARMAQAYDGRPSPVGSAVAELRARLDAPLRREGIEWYIGGSTAAWLLGGDVTPHDLDVGTTRAGVDRIAELLDDAIIEPIAPTERPGLGIVRGARAWVGTFADGTLVEWAVPIDGGSPLPLGEWTGQPGVARLEEAVVEGSAVRVTRPEYALVRAAENGRSERLVSLARFVRERGVDAELLRVLLARSPLPRARVAELARSVGLR